MTGRRVKKILSFSLVIFYILILIIPSSQAENKAKINSNLLATYVVNCPGAIYGDGAHNGDGTQDPGATNIAVRDNAYYEPRETTMSSPPYSVNITIKTSIFSSTVNDSNYWPLQIQPPNDPANYSITSLHIVLVAKDTNLLQPLYKLQEGHFSVSYDQVTGGTLAYPFSDGTWNHSPTLSWGTPPSYSSYSLFIGKYGSSSKIHSVVWDWDITNLTPLHTWTIDDILNPNAHFQVAWTFKGNVTGTPSDQIIQKYNYLGVYYTFTSNLDVSYTNITDTNNLYSTIWLLIIFLPAMLLNQIVPKIGFTIGILLMLIVMAATQVNFFYVAITGVISIGVMFYKKGGE